MKLLLEVTKEDLDVIDYITRVNVHTHLFASKFMVIRKCLGLNNYIDNDGNITGKTDDTLPVQG
jgi:hypothetical protein